MWAKLPEIKLDDDDNDDINGKSNALHRIVTFRMTLRTHNPVFKVTAFFEIKYIKNGQSYYRTLKIGNHTSCPILAKVKYCRLHGYTLRSSMKMSQSRCAVAVESRQRGAAV